MSTPPDPRVRAAEAWLGREGLGDVRVDVAGHLGEIAVLRAPGGHWNRLLAAETGVSAALRGVGFRYVTLDLESDGPREGRG